MYCIDRSSSAALADDLIHAGMVYYSQAQALPDANHGWSTLFYINFKYCDSADAINSPSSTLEPAVITTVAVAGRDRMESATSPLPASPVLSAHFLSRYH